MDDSYRRTQESSASGDFAFSVAMIAKTLFWLAAGLSVGAVFTFVL